MRYKLYPSPDRGRHGKILGRYAERGAVYQRRGCRRCCASRLPPAVVVSGRGRPVRSQLKGEWACILTIENPAILATESGYTGQRAVSTWAQRMKSLVDLGFILAKKGPVSDFQTVLLKNPNMVLLDLHRQGRFTNESQQLLFDQFRHRAIDIGAKDVIDATNPEAEKGEGPDAGTSEPSGATGLPGPATLTPPLSGKGET